MICSTCRPEGEVSRVYVGSSWTTLMGGCSFYDEQGRFHDHDPNTTTIEYRCSRGHRWVEKSKHECWCAVGGEK